MNYILFEHLDDLLSYLRACEERLTRLGALGERKYYDKIVISHGETKPLYGIPVEEGQRGAVEGDYLHGGEFVAGGGALQGHLESVNALLRRLPVREWHQPPRQISSLVASVACGASADLEKAKAAALRRLHDAWRLIPRQAQGVSTFFTYQDGDGGGAPSTMAVHVDGVEPWFDVKAWREKFLDLRLHVPPEECESLSFYVEWGYAYPRAQEYFLLYDENLDGNPVSICSAGAEIPHNRFTDPNVRDHWRESRWRLLHDADALGTRADELWRISGQLTPTVEDLSVESLPITAQIELPLAIGDSRMTLGSVTQLDQRICTLERDLEELHARRNRIEAAFHREYVPVYLFMHPSGCPAPGTASGRGAVVLPEDFQRFLKRPLGELATYEYVRGTLGGQEVHCVMGTQSVALGAALAVRCSSCYLQDSRWIEWGLPLFVRSDCALTLDIEEEAMAERFAGMLNDLGLETEASHAPILAEPGGTRVGELENLRMIRLPKGAPLDQNLAYVNAREPWPDALVQLAVQDLSQTVVVQQSEVPRNLAEMIEALRSESAAAVKQAEADWEDIRRKVRELQMEAKIADAAIDMTAEAYAKTPGSWKSFVGRVIQIDEMLSDMKLRAWGKWTVEEPEREKRLNVVEQSFLDTKTVLEERGQAFREAFDKCQRDRAVVEPMLEKLEGQRRQLEGELALLRDRHEALDRQRKQTAMETERLKNQVMKIGEAAQALADQRKALDDHRDRLDEVRGRVEQESAGSSLALNEMRQALGLGAGALSRAEDAIRMALERARLAEAARQEAKDARPAESPRSFWGRMRRMFGGR